MTIGGRLALMWNRLEETSPPKAEIDEIHRRFVPAGRPTQSDDIDDELLEVMHANGFRLDRLIYEEQLDHSADSWLELIFTYSNQLVLPRAEATALRAALRELIGDRVRVRNRALLVLATKS